MKIFNADNRCETLRNSIVFTWKSILMNALSQFDMNDLHLVSNVIYVVDKAALEEMNKLLNRLPALQNTYLDLLDKQNEREILEHWKFMYKHSSELLKKIDGYIEWIKNKKNGDRIEITKDCLDILLRLKARIEEFIEEMSLNVE